jgi:hypothetical protein
LKRLKRVYRYVFSVAYKWRKKTGMLNHLIINGAMRDKAKGGFPSGGCTRAAELFLLKKVQKGLKVKGTKILPRTC